MTPRLRNDSYLREEAAAWVLKQDRGLSATEQDEFMQWLAADPRHRDVWARQQENWRRLDLLGEWRPEHSANPNRDLLAPPVRWPRPTRWGWGVLAGGLAAAAAITVSFQVMRRPAAPEMAIVSPVSLAILETHTFPDGSSAELNRGTSLSIHYTAAERRVVLEQGEAHFIVAKNPQRPFVVVSAGVEVRAVGTAFAVRRAPQSVEVVVTEGKVKVDRPGSSGRGIESGGVEVVSGQRSVVPLDRTGQLRTATLSGDQLDQLLVWKPRTVDFTATPLRLVVAEFNRRNAPIHLVLADADLAELEVSATFRSDNVEGFVRLLEAGFGVRSERVGNEIRLRR